MEPATAQLIGIALAGIILVAGVLIPGRARVRSLLRLFAFQSLCLAGIAVLTAVAAGARHLFVSAALIMVIKVVFLPRYLTRIIARSGIAERLIFVVRPTLSMALALLMAVLGFYLTASLIPSLGANYFVTAVSVTLVFLGLLMLMVRRGLYGQIIGFLLMENGIFTFGLALTGGMPLLVELGIFFDVTVAAVLMALLSYRVQVEHGTTDTDTLTALIDTD